MRRHLTPPSLKNPAYATEHVPHNHILSEVKYSFKIIFKPSANLIAKFLSPSQTPELFSYHSCTTQISVDHILNQHQAVFTEWASAT